MIARSVPPVIDPEFAGRHTVRVLEDYSRARRTAQSTTTLTPTPVVLAATTLLMALRECLEIRRDIADGYEPGNELVDEMNAQEIAEARR